MCCRCDRGHGRGWAAVAGQVWDHAEEALDDHELRAVVHLMLLDTLQHLEAALRRRAVRHRHEFVGLRLRDALHKLRPRVAFGAEQIDDLRCGSDVQESLRHRTAIRGDAMAIALLRMSSATRIVFLRTVRMALANCCGP